MKKLGFVCQVAGIPQISDQAAIESLGHELFRNSNASMRYALIASIVGSKPGWPSIERTPDLDWNTAAIIGTCI
jgi:hypothetical protein